jgi:chromosome segregation ATPase
VQKELAEKAAELEQLRNEIGALKKSSDERFAAISAERETLAREHDKVVADREAARKELAEKVAQIEAQQNVSTCGGEEAARLAAERDALKEELATKTGELETLKGQIAILGKKNDENLAAIAQERDKVRADLENARKELAGRIHQLEARQQHASKVPRAATKRPRAPASTHGSQPSCNALAKNLLRETTRLAFSRNSVQRALKMRSNLCRNVRPCARRLPRRPATLSRSRLT